MTSGLARLIGYLPATAGNVMVGVVDWVGLRGSDVTLGSATMPGPDGAPVPAVAVKSVASSWFCAPGDSEQLATARIEHVTRALGFIPKDIRGETPATAPEGQQMSGGWT